MLKAVFIMHKRLKFANIIRREMSILWIYKQSSHT